MIKSSRNRSGILCFWDEESNASKVKSAKETVEQKQLNAHCEVKFPKHYSMMFHVVNESGSSGSGHYGGILNALGRKKGVPDWLVMVPSKKHNGLYIELKRSRKEDSNIKKEQRDFYYKLNHLGISALWRMDLSLHYM